MTIIMESTPGDHLPCDDESYPFVGREVQLDEMCSKLCQGQIQILQITGPPMVGKTRTAKRLVRQCLHQMFAEERKAAGYFISARGSFSVDSFLISLRAILKCPDESDPLVHIKSFCKKSFTFLLLDNTEDIIDSPCQGAFVKLCQDLATCSPDIRLVTTGRRDVIFSRLAATQSMISTLPPLERPEACLLLKEVVNADAEGGSEKPICLEDELGMDIVDHLGCLPLLIITTGCQIRNYDYEAREILQLFKNKREAGLLAVSDDDRYPPEERASAILGCFTSNLDESLKRALANLSEIPGYFSVEAAAAVHGYNSTALMKSQVILPLASRHVIMYNKKANRLDITPIIREFITKHFEGLKDAECTQRFCSFFLNQLVKVFSGYHADPKGAVSEIAQDFLKYVKFLREFQCDTVNDFERGFDLISRSEKQLRVFFPTDAGAFVRRMVSASPRFGDTRQQCRLVMAHCLILDDVLGRHSESAESLENARAVLESCINVSDCKPLAEKDAFLLAELYHIMGCNNYYLGEWKQVLKYIEKSQHYLKFCKLDESRRRYASSNDSMLGLTYMELDEYELAEKHHLLAIETRKSMWDEDHPYIGQSLNNLAIVYSKQGKWDKALPILEKSLEIKIKSTGEMATDTVTASMNNIAKCHMGKGDLDKALGTVRDALKMRKELIWKHYITACLKKIEGQIFMRQGEAQRAKESLEVAVDIRKEIFGTHVITAGAMKYFADALRMCGDFYAAETQYLEALKMGRLVLKDLPKNFGLADTYMGLARVHMALQQQADARMYAQGALMELMRIKELTVSRASSCQEKLQEAEQILSDDGTWEHTSDCDKIDEMAQTKSCQDALSNLLRSPNEVEKLVQTDHCKDALSHLPNSADSLSHDGAETNHDFSMLSDLDLKVPSSHCSEDHVGFGYREFSLLKFDSEDT